MRYAVTLERPAQRALDGVRGALYERLLAALRCLATSPRPRGVKKLHGVADLYRIRVGEWRIVYAIRDRELVVLVLRIAHRRDVYR
jgi:mRNA interferase RelE/StbE